MLYVDGDYFTPPFFHAVDDVDFYQLAPQVVASPQDDEALMGISQAESSHFLLCRSLHQAL